MNNWCQFKFIKESNYILSKMYLTANTKDGILNNIFLVDLKTNYDQFLGFSDVKFKKHSTYQPYTMPKIKTNPKRMCYQEGINNSKSEVAKLMSLNKITRMIQRPHSQSSRNLVTKF